VLAVWRKLEPFASGLLESEIETFADDVGAFTWSKETFFGGLYQKVKDGPACRRL
jgi:hypothetical protein